MCLYWLSSISKEVIVVIHLLYNLYFESVPYFESNQLTSELFQKSTPTPLPKVINVRSTIVHHQSIVPDPLDIPTINPSLLNHFKHSVVTQRLSYLSPRSLQTLLQHFGHHRIRPCNLSQIFRLPFEKVYVKHKNFLHIILIYVIVIFLRCIILACLLCLLFLFLKFQVKRYLTLSEGKQ